MEQQHGRCAVLSAEGDILANIAGRYSDGDTRQQVFLKAHSGDPILVHRVGRPPISIQRPSMTISLVVQPEMLHQLAKKQQLRGTGLMARVLYVLPSSHVGSRISDPPRVSVAVQEWYDRRVRALLGLPTVYASDGGLDPVIITLSAEAEELLRAFQDCPPSRIDRGA
jgi:hypothetical protein